MSTFILGNTKRNKLTRIPLNRSPSQNCLGKLCFPNLSMVSGKPCIQNLCRPKVYTVEGDSRFCSFPAGVSLLHSVGMECGDTPADSPSLSDDEADYDYG